MTKIHNLNKFPKGMTNSYCDISSLDTEYDIKAINDLGVDEVWYWYASGSYEGQGQILMRKDDKYDIHDMGHCSCYGPLEHAKFIPQTSEKLIKS